MEWPKLVSVGDAVFSKHLKWESGTKEISKTNWLLETGIIMLKQIHTWEWPWSVGVSHFWAQWTLIAVSSWVFQVYFPSCFYCYLLSCCATTNCNWIDKDTYLPISVSNKKMWFLQVFVVVFVNLKMFLEQGSFLWKFPLWSNGRLFLVGNHFEKSFLKPLFAWGRTQIRQQKDPTFGTGWV